MKRMDVRSEAMHAFAQLDCGGGETGRSPAAHGTCRGAARRRKRRGRLKTESGSRSASAR